MSRLLLTSFTALSILSLAACSSTGGIGGMSQSETLGTGAGAAAGGLIGNVAGGGVLGTVLGAAAGGVIGNRLANALSDDAQQSAAEAAVKAAQGRTGERFSWKKTDALFRTTSSGWASATAEPFRDKAGRNCRTIHQSATSKDGRTAEDNVTLCQGPSGWGPA